jgi:cyclopropane-fatty-acyl-phospholipid synthase
MAGKPMQNHSLLHPLDAAIVSLKSIFCLHARDTRECPSSVARAVTELLSAAGIEVNGARPWDIQVHDDRFFERVLIDASIGLGESYMDGWWDVPALDEFFTRIHQTELYNHVPSPRLVWLTLISHFLNLQNRIFSHQVAVRHYDLGNDLYRLMLDRYMQYSCAYWRGTTSLDEAQVNKLDLICRKLQLAPGMRVLELGGGFGGFAQFAAGRYGSEVVSYNISHEQVKYARQICSGLPVRIEERDYRDAHRETRPFDRVVCIGLCEHVGYKNYRRFLKLAHGLLRDGGLFLLHTIGANRSYTCTDPWVDKYIFPNGVMPSVSRLAQAMEGLWVIEDWHNFGPDYDRTLLAWWSNFDRGWPKLREVYGERFYRTWTYYLMACAGAFRARKLQLWQFVLSKGDIPAYSAVR